MNSKTSGQRECDALIDTSNLPGLKLYFIRAHDYEGDCFHAFVSAYDAASARRHFESNCTADDPFGPVGEVLLFEFSAVESPRALEWGLDIKQVDAWAAVEFDVDDDENDEEI